MLKIHDKAIVESPSIGSGTRIWAFAHVLPGAVIGSDCNICDHTFIENDVVVGDRVTIKCGVQLWDGVTLEDDVFIGPNASKDRFAIALSDEPQRMKIALEAELAALSFFVRVGERQRARAKPAP